MTARPCLDCRRATRNGSRCPTCAAAFRARRDQQRGTRTQRGYDNRWMRLSAEAIRLQPWCSECRATVDLTADHIDPLSKGGVAVTVADVRVLCRSCNSRRGNRS